MKKLLMMASLCCASALLLTACGSGDDGKNGANGTNGIDGTNGSNGTNGTDGTNGTNGSNGVASLVKQTALTMGSSQCWLGGVRIDSGLDANSNAQLDSGEIIQTSYVCTPDNFAGRGVPVPYTVLRNDLENGAYPGSTFEIRNGGYGSDMVGHPTNPMQFYAVTDRGPNADFTGAQGAGKMFPVETYTPKIGLFEIQAAGNVALVKTIPLKRPDGTLITGLPNKAGLGGTNEIPYNSAGQIIRVDMTQAYDATTNPIKLDDYGLDSEGLVAMKDGTFWVSDEYGPHIVHYSAAGVEIGRINPFAADTRNTWVLPAEFGKRRANRGMEGLTITPDEKTLVGIMQSTISNPNSAVNNGDLTRIVTVNLETGAIGQYLYKQEIKQNSNSAIVALSNTSFLILERDGGFQEQTPGVMKHVYKIDLRNATNLETVAAAGDLAQDANLGLTIGGQTLEQYVIANNWQALATKGIVPASKTLVVDMVAQVNYPHDKMEGLWVIDNKRLGVVNDDDFATWVTSNKLEQKYLDTYKSKIDGNVLYIIDNLDLNPAP